MVEGAELLDTIDLNEYFKELDELQAQYPDYHPTVLFIIADERTREKRKKRIREAQMKKNYNVCIYQVNPKPPPKENHISPYG
jgi:hypothetical protein